jgi:hypothetical protein
VDRENGKTQLLKSSAPLDPKSKYRRYCYKLLQNDSNTFAPVAIRSNPANYADSISIDHVLVERVFVLVGKLRVAVAQAMGFLGARPARLGDGGRFSGICHKHIVPDLQRPGGWALREEAVEGVYD